MQKYPRILYILVAFLLLALLVSTAINVLLFKTGYEYYAELTSVRLDPLGLNVYAQDATQQSEKAVEKQVAVFFGDSRAEQWVLPQLTRYRFVNRGIGAQTSAQTAERFMHDVGYLHPDVVIVQVGINDLKAIPLFPNQETSITERCKANIKRIVDEASSLGSKVILTTIFPVGEVPLERRPFWSDRIPLAIKNVNEYLHSLASQNVSVLDTGSILADERDMLQTTYSIDTLHVNASGYAALNDKLVVILNGLTR